MFQLPSKAAAAAALAILCEGASEHAVKPVLWTLCTQLSHEHMQAAELSVEAWTGLNLADISLTVNTNVSS